MTSAPAIGFEYRPSRWVAGLLVVVTLLTLLAAISCGAPWMVRSGLAVLAVVCGGRALRRLRLPISAAGWNRGGWTLRGLDGSDDPAALISSKVMHGVVLLHLASPRHGKLTLWLMPDNSDPDIRRRLRMRLAVLGQGEAAQ